MTHRPVVTVSWFTATAATILACFLIAPYLGGALLFGALGAGLEWSIRKYLQRRDARRGRAGTQN